MRDRRNKEINRFTLKIEDKALEAEYRYVSIREGVGQFRFAYFMGILFYIAFIIVDQITYTSVARSFLAIRIFLVLPVLFLTLTMTYFNFYVKHARAINLFAVIIAGVGIILMGFFGFADPNISRQYGGMVILFFFLYSFFKMPYRDALFVGLVLVLGFLAVELWVIEASLAVFISTAFYTIGANIVGVSVAYVMEKQMKKEFLLNKTLSESVIKDALTNLYNRHYFEQFLVKDIVEFINRSRGVKHIERRLGDIKAAKYGLFMIDIDYFKRVNDAFGHHSGDLVLQQFADILKQHVRRSDDVLRVGGEEFLLVLKLTTDEYLVEFMKKIGRIVEQYDFKVEGGSIIGCTASMGMVVIPNPRTDDVDELVRYADRALYKSKDSGRNRGNRAYILQGELEFEEILW